MNALFGGFLQYLQTQIKAFWCWLRLLAWFLRATRFSLVTILLCAVLLLMTAQGEELAQLIGVGESARFLWLILGLELFAFQAWYWARITMRLSATDQGATKLVKELGEMGLLPDTTWPDYWRKALPRIYAGAVFATVLLAILRTGLDGRWFAFVILLGFGFLTVVLLVKRLPILEAFGQPKLEQESVNTLGEQTAGMQAILWVSMIGAAISMIAVTAAPVAIGAQLGATAVAFFACAFIIPVGSYLVILARSSGFPVILALIAWGAFCSLFNDNHRVPTLIDSETDPRVNLKTALDSWLAQFSAETETQQPIPLVIVATAGGGLRAAYWTTTVLGALQDECANFSEQTFAISGVSGGSLGAAVFAAEMAGRGAGERCAPSTAPSVQKATNTVLSEDFLGPTVAAMLFPDLLQRFWPLPSFPSRGTVLANSWASAWDTHCAAGKGENCDGRLNAAFNSVGRTENPWRPALMMNGAHQQTGKRYITSQIKVEQEIFYDAFDSQHVLGKDVSLATAALSSARFPLVSPPGRLVDKEGNFKGRVLDGGYFENFGAETASEILQYLMENEPSRPVKPIVIQIVSDTTMTPRDYPAHADPAVGVNEQTGFLELAPEERENFLYETLAPPQGLYQSRVARGVLAAKSLAQLVDHIAESGKYTNLHDPFFAHFQMCFREKDKEPPLGWMMSGQTGRDLVEHLKREAPCDNHAQFQAVLDALRGG